VGVCESQSVKLGVFSVKTVVRGSPWVVLKSSVYWKTWFECPDAGTVRWRRGCACVVSGVGAAQIKCICQAKKTGVLGNRVGLAQLSHHEKIIC
jgi:hypothetical protein